jgi:predicted ABC-type ATPase
LREPFLLMIAGPNGAGKTTLTRWLRDRDIEFGQYINPDDIARQLEGSYAERTAEAQVVADQRRDACIEAMRSFSFETVMSHPSKLDVLVRARRAGFFVQLFFVGIDDPQTCIERVALRVAQDGHDVPADKIVSRWTRTMGQLSQAIRLSNRAFVFDNSVTGVTATGPRLVFQWGYEQVGPRGEFEHFPPVPPWLQLYVSKPLGIEVP